MFSHRSLELPTTTRLSGMVWPFLCGCALLLGFSRSAPVVVSRSADTAADPFEWASADGPGGTHYASRGAITAANVRGLEVAWRYRTGDAASREPGVAGTAFEATPIMVDGILYVSTPRSRVIALDADTGSERWTFDPGVDATDTHHRMTTSRGVSTWLDAQATDGPPCRRRIFLASFDARLFALDGRTGRLCTDFGEHGSVDLGVGVPGIEGRRDHYKQTAPPAVVGDVVVVGSSIYDGREAVAPSGVVRAFDARTGAVRWRWEPLVALSGEGEGTTGAANTWATMIADEARDLLFVPTGSPSPDHYGGLRPGDNRYANSLVAPARVDRGSRVELSGGASRSLGLRSARPTGVDHAPAWWSVHSGGRAGDQDGLPVRASPRDRPGPFPDRGAPRAAERRSRRGRLADPAVPRSPATTRPPAVGSGGRVGTHARRPRGVPGAGRIPPQ